MALKGPIGNVEMIPDILKLYENGTINYGGEYLGTTMFQRLAVFTTFTISFMIGRVMYLNSSQVSEMLLKHF
jgi:hypothetical protein